MKPLKNAARDRLNVTNIRKEQRDGQSRASHLEREGGGDEEANMMLN